MDPFGFLSNNSDDNSNSVEIDTQHEQCFKKSDSQLIPANQNSTVRTISQEGNEFCIKKCDILVFGDKKAGKKTFME